MVQNIQRKFISPMIKYMRSNKDWACAWCIDIYCGKVADGVWQVCKRQFLCGASTNIGNANDVGAAHTTQRTILCFFFAFWNWFLWNFCVDTVSTGQMPHANNKMSSIDQAVEATDAAYESDPDDMDDDSVRPFIKDSVFFAAKDGLSIALFALLSSVDSAAKKNAIINQVCLECEYDQLVDRWQRWWTESDSNRNLFRVHST